MHFRQYILVFLLLLPFEALSEADMTFPTAPLAIKTHDKILHFTVEVATSTEQQEHGLMFRKSLPPMHGMIFIFPNERQVTFWMKNTPLPLDMLFIDGKGIVRQIKENASPESTDHIPSKSKVRAVIELEGGSAVRNHITLGDKVVYSIFP